MSDQNKDTLIFAACLIIALLVCIASGWIK